MKKTLYNRIRLDKLFSIAFFAGILLYAISNIWINYNGKSFYHFDMYSDAYVAKLMWDKKTLFPENWVFGNQYYIVATPTLAALLYGLLKDSFMAMATASCLMMFFILLSFIYCFGKVTNRISLAVGLFCMVGGTILGTSASSYTNGFQLFFTMASYYAIYLIGILLTLGLYFRIRSNEKYHIITVIAILILVFALGMNSVREMLILCLPLVASEFLFDFYELLKTQNLRALIQKNYKSIAFSISVLFSNLLGIIFVKFIESDSVFIVENAGIASNFRSVIKSLLDISGLSLYRGGIRNTPLFLAALFLLAVVIATIIIIIYHKDNGCLPKIIVFLIISLFGVCCAGIFFIKTRGIYFFVWYLLVDCCIIYFLNLLKGKLKTLFLTALLICGIGNYVYNYVPDIKNQQLLNKSWQDMSIDLKSDNISCVYVDIGTSPVIAAYSDDEYVSGSIRFDYKKDNGYLMNPNPYLLDKEIFRNPCSDDKYLMIASWRWNMLEKEAPKDYVEELKSELELQKSFVFPTGDIYYLYTMKSNIIAEYSE